MGIEQEMNLEAATPREIDEALAAIYTRSAPYRARQMDANRSGRKYANAGGTYAAQAERKFAAADTAKAWAEKIEAEGDPYEAEYKRRGGWARYFWCLSDGGHVHAGRQCPSIRFDTPMSWVPSLADKSVEEMVAEFGCSVCTKCFPTAPVFPAYTAAEKARQVEQAAKDALLCPGSGQQALDQDFRYYQPRGTCPHCQNPVTPTSTGKVRKHKMPKDMV